MDVDKAVRRLLTQGILRELFSESEKLKGLFKLQTIRTQQGLAAAWRETRLLALMQQHIRIARVVVALQALIQRVLRVFGLDKYFAGNLATPCPSADLHELLEQAFRRTKIGGIQAVVGTEDTNQCQARKIVSFGHHLRADQNIRITFANLAEQGLPLSWTVGAVPVQPQDASFREMALQGFFDTLGSTPIGLQIRVATVRASLRNDFLMAAVMAAKM